MSKAESKTMEKKPESKTERKPEVKPREEETQRREVVEWYEVFAKDLIYLVYGLSLIHI